MKKIVSILLLIIIASVTTPAIASAATTATTDSVTLFDGKYYNIKQEENKILIFDKETNESATMEIKSDDAALLTLSDGKVVKYTKDSEGNIYEDNQLVKSAPSVVVESKDLAIQARAGQYHYFQTTYSDTSTDATIQSIALGIFSFVPYVGWIGTIASVVEAFKSLGKTTMYTKTDHYYIDGYSRYKYVTYYYSDAKRTQLVRTTTLYKDMW